MKSFGWGVVGGMVIALTVFVSTGVVDQHHEHHKLKQECEKNLPRNQVCVMKLVPKGE